MPLSSFLKFHEISFTKISQTSPPGINQREGAVVAHTTRPLPVCLAAISVTDRRRWRLYFHLTPAAPRPRFATGALLAGMRRYSSSRRFSTLFRHGIKPHLRGFQSLRWHADVQTRPKENAGAHTCRRGHIGNQRIVVRVILLDRADIAVGSESVDSLAVRVVIAIVAV